MRLFVAAELTDEMVEALVETQAGLRDTVHGRYVAPDSLHVTLAFLGQVNHSRVGELTDVLYEATAATEPIEAMLGPLGSFGRRSSAIVWQGFQEGSEELKQVAARVRSALDDHGFAFDRKGFLPHITLMRRADLSCASLGMAHVAAGTIDTVTLFSSDLSGDRPRYEAIERIRLGAPERDW